MTSLSRKPSRIRLSLMVFCAVYPLVTLATYSLSIAIPDWQIWQRSLVMVPMIVLAMVYVIIPVIQTRLSRFL